MAILDDFRLRVFMAVAEQGSFTKAARSLGISQPAVSQNIGELEKTVGAELFLRQRGMVALTERGVTFKEYALRVLYWCDAAENAFSGPASAGTKITVSCDPMSQTAVLPDLIARASASVPGLQFDIVPAVAPRPDLLAGSDVSSSNTGSANLAPSSKSPDSARHAGPATAEEVLSICDIAFYSLPHKPELSLEESASLVKTVMPSFITSDYGLSGISSLMDIPASKRFALWQPYRPLLPFEIAARAAAVSDSPELLSSLAAGSQDIVAIVPSAQALYSQELRCMNISMPSLAFDIFAKPSPGFAGRRLYAIIRDLLALYCS